MDGTALTTHTRTRTIAAAAALAALLGGPVATAARGETTGGASAPAQVTPAPAAGAAQAPAPGTTSAAPAPSPSPAPAPAPGASLGDRLPLQRGMRGSDVAELQRLLSRVGQGVSADGDFGPGTARALASWESSAGRTADGVLRSGDLAVLRRAAAKAPAPSGPPPAPPATATITAAGKAVAPAGAPPAVAAIIAAGNRIALTPYRYGGGHPSFTDTAYDCSGSVSFALHGANLLSSPWDSTMLESLGAPGPGTWVTVYANAGHTFMVVAGIRYDTSGQRQAGTRWQPVSTRSYDGFVVRHPTGL